MGAHPETWAVVYIKGGFTGSEYSSTVESLSLHSTIITCLSVSMPDVTADKSLGMISTRHLLRFATKITADSKSASVQMPLIVRTQEVKLKST